MQTSISVYARIVDAFGKVEKKLPGGAAFRALSVGDRVPIATTLRTGSDAALLVELPDKHMVRVGASSTVVLSQLGQDKQFALKVLSGQVWALVKKANHPAKFTVETSSGIAGVTGTFFGVGLDDDTGEMVVSTEEGSVEVQSVDEGGVPFGAPIAVRQGQMIKAARRQALKAAVRQTREHRTMWRLLQREGAWTQQNRPGVLRLGRGNEAQLREYLQRKSPHNPKPMSQPRFKKR